MLHWLTFKPLTVTSTIDDTTSELAQKGEQEAEVYKPIVLTLSVMSCWIRVLIICDESGHQNLNNQLMKVQKKVNIAVFTNEHQDRQIEYFLYLCQLNCIKFQKNMFKNNIKQHDALNIWCVDS